MLCEFYYVKISYKNHIICSVKMKSMGVFHIKFILFAFSFHWKLISDLQKKNEKGMFLPTHINFNGIGHIIYGEKKKQYSEKNRSCSLH